MSDNIVIRPVDIQLIVGIVTVMCIIIGALIKAMHSQAMKKFDRLIDTVGKMATTMAVHDEKLSSGSDEFRKISEHQKEQDACIMNLDKRVTVLESLNNS